MWTDGQTEMTKLIVAFRKFREKRLKREDVEQRLPSIHSAKSCSYTKPDILTLSTERSHVPP